MCNERRFCLIVIPAQALPAAGRGNVFHKPLDSSFRRAATGILGGLFLTPLYPPTSL